MKAAWSEKQAQGPLSLARKTLKVAFTDARRHCNEERRVKDKKRPQNHSYQCDQDGHLLNEVVTDTDSCCVVVPWVKFIMDVDLSQLELSQLTDPDDIPLPKMRKKRARRMSLGGSKELHQEFFISFITLQVRRCQISYSMIFV